MTSEIPFNPQVGKQTERPQASHSDRDMVTCLRLPDSDVSAAFQQLCAPDMINLFIFPSDQGCIGQGG